jgi:cyclic dehypoxanthinyl futalosine synthase
VCWVRCKFCAFYRVPNDPEGYLWSDEEILAKVQETVDLGGVEILFQGGLNPRLKIDYYENIFAKIKSKFPQVILHALSPTEIIYIAHISRLSLRECLQRLQKAGLHSIPGAGGEILVDRVRHVIAPYKDTTEEWLACMREAAALGICGTASMMFGHVETLEERVEHFQRIRDLQDECAPFRAFVAWNFQPESTQLPIARKASGFEYLRCVAVARIFLDNIDNLQVSILTQGPKIAQLALGYGANDFGSIMIEEKVVSAEGDKYILSAKEFEHLIRDAGYEPYRRNTRYELL